MLEEEDRVLSALTALVRVLVVLVEEEDVVTSEAAPDTVEEGEDPTAEVLYSAYDGTRVDGEGEHVQPRAPPQGLPHDSSVFKLSLGLSLR